MIQLQCISKILQTADISLITLNNLDKSYFTGYEEEVEFILNHYQEYRNVPDKATFLSKFPEFEIVECNESDRYLIETLREQHLFELCVPIIQKSADLLNEDSNAAVSYAMNEFKKLELTDGPKVIDITSKDALQKRKEEYIKRRENPQNWFFTTGFEELDSVIRGIQRFEELIVIVARTNQGKSWILEKIATHVWQIGFNVGYISPEMGSLSIGYRFDTLVSHISNKNLVWGNKELDMDIYDEHIDNISERDNHFFTAVPSDFRGSITVSKLKTFIQQNKLDLIAVDGISYLSDERIRKGETYAQSLTHISEDLMALSVELSVPIIVVVQANRSAAQKEDNPELDSIRDSDGIAYNASKVISLRQRKDHVLIMEVKKQRSGPVGAKLCYGWDIDTGTFTYIENGVDEDNTRSNGVEVQTVGNRRRARKNVSEEDSF